MKRCKIIADDKIPFLRGVLEPWADVVYLPGGKIAPGDVRDADALLTRTRTRCDRSLLEGSSVRFIATATIGFDHLDIAYLASAAIAWTNAPGCNAGSVAQYLGSALTGFGVPLSGKVLGVVGVGNVGRWIVALGEALGMQVLCNDPPRAEREGSAGFSGIDELLAESDFLTFHVPLVREGEHPTFHLGDAALFKKMKRDAVLLNTSRGEVVDNAALLEALRNETIREAVLDVWENEPEIDRELLEKVRFGTPHIAGYSTDGKANGTAMSVRALAKFFGIAELLEWEPDALPEPENPEIALDAATSPEAQLATAFLRTYDVGRDDAALREAPSRFEELRGNYRMRREPGAFMVSGGCENVREMLHRAGFRVKK